MTFSIFSGEKKNQINPTPIPLTCMKFESFYLAMHFMRFPAIKDNGADLLLLYQLICFEQTWKLNLRTQKIESSRTGIFC